MIYPMDDNKKMKITFLVGNGFDINLGAKTSYSDFYEWYLSDEREASNDAEEIRKLKEHIRKDRDEGRGDWSDLEIGLGIFTSDFSEGQEELFVNCYKDILLKMVNYIKTEETNKSNDFDETSIDKSYSALGRFYSELPKGEMQIFDDMIEKFHNEESEIQFLSFNYTRLLDKYVPAIGNIRREGQPTEERIMRFKVNQSVVHVNGTLEEFPILGVDNESQLLNEEFHSSDRILNLMIKQKCKDSIGSDDYSIALNAINESDIVCIYGMSLGECDKFWWQAIIKWLKEKDSRRLIIYWFSNPPVMKMFPFYTDNVMLVKDMFLDYSILSKEEDNEIRKRIHVIFNSKIFDMSFRSGVAIAY